MSEELLIRYRQDPIDSSIDVPGSKSIANRALVVAALSNGASTIIGVPSGDDVDAMVGGLRKLGARLTIDSSTIVVAAPIELAESSHVVVDAGLAGTTSRFLLALASLRSGTVEIAGGTRLSVRPFGELIDALRTLGANVQGGPGLPVIASRSALRGGSVNVSGEVSSQFISALMMIGPMLDEGIRIAWSGDLVSRPYVEMTASVMSRFGAHVVMQRDAVEVRPSSYSGQIYQVEVDASSAGYPAAAAAMVGGRVRISGAADIRLQPDRLCFEILRRMGCAVNIVGHDIEVARHRSKTLEAIEIDLREASDLVPTVAALGCVAHGTTKIRGVGFVRQKESDRIGDLATEIRKFGIAVIEHPDGMDIVGGVPSAALVDPHDDHRLAMALGLVGLVTPGTRIKDPGVVSKSWPEYFDAMEMS